MSIRFLLWFLGFTLGLAGCDTYTGAPVDDLESEVIGTWSRTDVIPSGRTEADFRYFDTVFAYTFNSDDTYSNTIDFYGFKDENPDEIIGQSETIGTFQVKGDSIFISAKQNTSWEKRFKPEPVMTQYEENEVYGSRFEIVENTLTLYYISYPADAPVPTQMSYERVN
jgi:hypothetical protein